MPTYVSLVSFTQEGMKNVKETGRRAKIFAQKAKSKGIEIKHTYWTTGEYDIVHIFEAPSDKMAASVGFALGSMGNVRTKTLRAFDMEEMSEVLLDVYELQIDKGTLK
jgi:uncharacterized protein with GYD domain